MVRLPFFFPSAGMASEKILLTKYNGLTEYQHVDEERPGDLIIETVQDCEPIIEGAKILSEETPGKDFRHVACVPMFFLDKAAKEGWLHDKAKWKRFLNDPDNKCFRTWPGRV
jgi:hypothetical protein